MCSSAKPCMPKKLQEKLKPCPYCMDGTSDILIKKDGFYYYVECQKCKMKSPYVVHVKKANAKRDFEYKEAIDIWNKLKIKWKDTPMTDTEQLEEERNYLAWKLEDLCKNWSKGKECSYKDFSQEYWLNLAKGVLACM